MYRMLYVLLSILLTGCSTEQLVELVAPKKEMQFAKTMAAALCDGEHSKLEEFFDPELLIQSEHKILKVPNKCSTKTSKLRPAGYYKFIQSGNKFSHISFIQEYRGKYTLVFLKVSTNSSALYVSAWQVSVHDQKPDDVIKTDNFFRLFSTLAWFFPIFLIASVIFTIWFFKRNIRKADSEKSDF